MQERHSIIIDTNLWISFLLSKRFNFLLALAKDACADYLITGDKDLLIIKKFEGTQIVTIAEYQMELL